MAARRVAAWARKEGVSDRVEIMGYCDGDLSVDWIKGVGGRVMNLLTKGSEKHCREQLRQTPEQHRKRVLETIRRRTARASPSTSTSRTGRTASAIPSTTCSRWCRCCAKSRSSGSTCPTRSARSRPRRRERYVGLMTSTWPDVDFEFHAHNDYGLAIANCLAAARAGARGVHTSVNGMGERAGNTRLAEVVAALHDHTPLRTGVDEAELVDVSRLVETFSGKTVSVEHADRRPRRVHADRRHPRRRRRQGRPLREPARAGALRPRAPLRARQALGQGLARPQPEGARHRAAGARARPACSRASSSSATRSTASIPTTCRYIIADVLNRPEQRPLAVDALSRRRRDRRPAGGRGRGHAARRGVEPRRPPATAATTPS